MGRNRGSRRKTKIEFPQDLGGIDGKKLNDLAEKMGKNHKGNTNQVRKMYNAFKKIQVEWNGADDKNQIVDKTIGDIHLVRPKLAYSAARNKKMKGLKNDIDRLINNLDPEVEDIENFFKLLEAFIGYHKYFTEVK